MKFLLRLLLLSCAIASPWALGEETAHVVILHVNDIHGQTLGKSENGQLYGGYPRLATAVERVRKEVGPENMLLIHAGDEFSRGDELTTATRGAANIAIMNAIEFSAMTPGNGEFYSGPDNLQKRIAEAHFPVIAGNVKYRLDGSNFSRRGAVLEAGHIKFGLLGLCFLRKEHPSALPLSVADPIAAARELVPKLAAKSDFVIAVDHLGAEQDQTLARTVPGIGLIVGGHSHTTLQKGLLAKNPDGHPVLIVQAGEYLHYLGRVDLLFARQSSHWTLQDAQARLIALGPDIPEDPTIKAMIVRMWPTTAPTTPPSEVPATTVRD